MRGALAVGPLALPITLGAELPMNHPHSYVDRYRRLSSLARDPQTAAIYDARSALAALIVARQFNAALIASGIKRDRRPMRWMSAIGYRHMSEAR